MKLFDISGHFSALKFVLDASVSGWAQGKGAENRGKTPFPFHFYENRSAGGVIGKHRILLLYMYPKKMESYAQRKHTPLPQPALQF